MSSEELREESEGGHTLPYDSPPPTEGLRDVPAQRRIWLLAIAAGAIGAVLGWGLGEILPAYLHWNTNPAALGAPSRENPDPEVMKRLVVARSQAEGRNAAVAYGAFAAVLGLAYGFGGGLARRSSTGSLLGGATGLILGAIAGVGACLLLVPYFIKQTIGAPDPMLPLMIHGGIYAAIGAAAGLAFGLSLLRFDSALSGLLAGALGAGLGSFLYGILGSLAFPLESDFKALPPSATSRLLSHLCVALMTSICCAGVLGGRKKPNLPSSSASTAKA